MMITTANKASSTDPNEDLSSYLEHFRVTVLRVTILHSPKKTSHEVAGTNHMEYNKHSEREETDEKEMKL